MEFKGLHIHFVGVGGISMSALAALVLAKGANVSGSDASTRPPIQNLKFYLGHKKTNIEKDCDLVIINGAIQDNNPEVLQARKMGIPILAREELLAEVEKGYKNRIAVAGAHGKSTTTAMIAAIFQKAGLNPTVHNGAKPITNYKLQMTNSGEKSSLILGGDEYFVTEACEFKRSFLKLSPTVAVITNIDADHLDCYCDLEEIKQTFKTFARNSDFVIYNGDCPNSKNLGGFLTFGLGENCDIRAVNISEYEPGKYSFQLTMNTEQLTMKVKLNVVGRHNVYNALAAASVGLHFGIAPDIISKALFEFKGTQRRFETIGKIGKAVLITDYAHHPAELCTTITTARSLYKRFLIVFQPHTYTRTIALFPEFVKVLASANCVLYKTFAAREKPIKGGTAQDLARALSTKYFASNGVLRAYLEKVAPNYDALILTGAGDIWRVVPQPYAVTPCPS